MQVVGKVVKAQADWDDEDHYIVMVVVAVLAKFLASNVGKHEKVSKQFVLLW